MISKPKDDEKPEPGSKADLIPDIKTDDPSKEVEEDGEVPGGGNFA